MTSRQSTDAQLNLDDWAGDQRPKRKQRPHVKTGNVEVDQSLLSKRRQSNLIDLTGMKFGKLTVLEYRGCDRSSSLWACKCECGSTPIIRGQHLRTRHYVSCGCERPKRLALVCQNNARNKYDPSNWVGTIVSIYRHGANKRGLSFCLTKEDVRRLVLAECHYCGALPSNVYNPRSELTQIKYRYNGIDRVDNRSGYTVSNCVSCCKTCNRAKNSLTLDEFMSWAKRVVERSLCLPVKEA